MEHRYEPKFIKVVSLQINLFFSSDVRAGVSIPERAGAWRM